MRWFRMIPGNDRPRSSRQYCAHRTLLHLWWARCTLPLALGLMVLGLLALGTCTGKVQHNSGATGPDSGRSGDAGPGRDGDNSAPSVPSSLVADPVSPAQVWLSWVASTDPESGVGHYLVFRDSVTPIGQATGTTFMDNTVDPDTGYNYAISAVNGSGLVSSLSSPWPVTTPEVVIPPSILSVMGKGTSVQVTFSKILAPASAEEITNYSIGIGIKVKRASLGADQVTVTLTTSAHTQGVTYTLTVTGVGDLEGNLMPSTPMDYQYTSTLVGYWSFDEGVGLTAGDASGNRNTGTLENGTAWVPGLRGSSGVKFDGIDDLVRVSDSDSLDFGPGEDFSISLWFRDSTLGPDQADSPEFLEKRVSEGGGKYQLRSPDSAGALRVQISDETDQDSLYTTSGNLSDGKWHHLVVIRDSDAGIIAYVDGNWDGSNNIVTAGGRVTNSADLQFGAGNFSSGFYDGELDEVRIYRQALSRAEIGQLFAEGSGPDITPPIPPNNLIATLVTSARVNLSWDASTDSESGVDHYLVFGDGVAIGQATGTTFTANYLTPETDYTYEVSAVNGVELKSGRSAALLVTIPKDVAPPSILSVMGSDDSVQVTFSEPLDSVSATDTANYFINRDTQVNSASLESGQITVTLNITPAHTQGETYTLTTSGVADLAGILLPTTPVNYEYDSSLVGFWSFDDGASTAANDLSGHGNTGILNNGPVWIAGKLGNALEFEASRSQSVLVEHSNTLDFGDASFSIVLWMKYWEDVDSDVLRKGSTNTSTTWYKIEVPESDQAITFNVRTETSSPTLTSPLAYNDGLWHHVAAIRDVENGLISLYLDGVRVASAANPEGSVSNTANLTFASKDTKDDDFFGGGLDEIAMYRRALSVTEVQDLYSAGLKKTMQ